MADEDFVDYEEDDNEVAGGAEKDTKKYATTTTNTTTTNINNNATTNTNNQRKRALRRHPHVKLQGLPAEGRPVEGSGRLRLRAPLRRYSYRQHQ